MIIDVQIDEPVIFSIRRKEYATYQFVLKSGASINMGGDYYITSNGNSLGQYLCRYFNISWKSLNKKRIFT
jgi:hypothetical protein